MTNSIRTVLLILLGAALIGPAVAQDAAQNPKRQVVYEPVSVTAGDIYRVRAEDTHSGYPVPRYVSLKFGKVNGRQGPSTQHAVLWQYRRKGLPLIVVEEMDIWRKVRDPSGDEAWMRTQALSGERMVIVTEETALRTRPQDDDGTLAIIEADVLLRLDTCPDDAWCRVRASSGEDGWIRRAHIWGADPL